MAEPYSFSKNLTSTFGSFRKKFGFKRKGSRFTRDNLNLTQEIYIQRSQFNIPELPSQFYVNIGFQLWGHGRLDRPTQVKFPPHYRQFFEQGLNPNFDRSKIMKEFTKKEREEIRNYNDSRRWGYSSEEELVNNLEVAATFLSKNINQIYDEIHSLLSQESCMGESSRICQEIIDRFYLGYIPQESRWD